MSSYNEGIIQKRRAGTVQDPFLSITESKVILNSVAQLSEIPNEGDRVTVYGYSEKTTSVNLTSAQFYVDYNNGIVIFNPSENGKTISFVYMGTGYHYLPANRVWTQVDGGNVVETLKDVADDISIKEAQRATSETNRINAETSRTTNEASRNTAETARASAETARVTNMNNINANMTINWKASVATYASLPSSNRTTGDTYGVTNDGTPANNGFWRWSGTAWVKITTLNPTGTATQVDLDSLDAVRADFERQRSMSGVVDYVAPLGNIGVGISTASYPRGAVSTPYLPSFTMSMVNLFTTTAFSSLINGYKLNVTDIGGIATRNYMYLNAPPTYGTRDDLVFLEAWFPQTGNPKGVMSWRIRVVDGVDFIFAGSREGFAYPSLNATGAIAQAQGGNAQPLNYALGSSAGDPVHAYSSFYNIVSRQGTIQTGKKIAIDDVGLYVAGDGSTTSKSTLLTADGYVYAIPLFRVKRRNSGGYRSDNQNGARDYFSPNIRYGTTDSASNSTINVGDTAIIRLTSNYALANVGDILYLTSAPTIRFQVLEKLASNQVTIKSVGTGNTTGAQNVDFSFGLQSDRPDGLYSNVIDANDIIDLRHQIPIFPSYEGILESNFDKLIRGESATANPETIQCDTYGLKRAPLGIQQQLQATTIKRPDGTSADLVNLLGIDGNCEDISRFSASSTILSLDPNNKTIGNNSIKVATSGAGIGFFMRAGTTPSSPLLPLDSTKYYVLVADVKNGTSNGGARIRYYNGTTTVAKTFAYSTESNKFVTQYIKLQPSDLSASDNRLYFDVNGNVTGQYAYIDAIRLYEINQATYNLIDIDANWTGADNIAVRFPHVDSLPNFVENLYGNAGLTIGNGTPTWVENANYLDVTSDAASTSRYVQSRRISVLPNTNYVFSYTASNISGVDDPKTSIRKGSDNGVTAIAGATAITGTGAKTYLFNTGSETEIIFYLYGSVATASVQTKRYENIMLEQNVNAPVAYVPFGRHYIPADYQGYNAYLGNTYTSYHYQGVNGDSFNAQRFQFSDAQISESNIDIVDPTWNGVNNPKHITTTQATSGVWASGDTIKLHSDYGVITGVSVQVSRVLALSTDGLTATLDDVSKFAVSDTFIIMDATAGSSTARTITAIDTANKTVTISVALSASAVGQIAVENTSATSAPQVAYTLQQGKTAQAGGTASITLASDASTVTDYYKNLQVSGTFGGLFQTRTITAYNGSTKVATVNTNWTNPPGSSSVYSISAAGTWTGLGTKDATFTFGTMPTAVDATLGNANALNATITNTAVYPSGKGISNVPETIYDAYVNGGRNVSTATVSVKANLAGKVSANTDANPHVAKGYYATSLMSPSTFTMGEFVGGYAPLSLLDSTITITTVSTNLNQSQQIFSFDMIRAIEDKFGEIPADGLAAKIAWVKANVSIINCEWYGFGSSPTGNKATLNFWNVSSTAWVQNTSGYNHTNATVTRIAQGVSSMASYIDANGMIHFLAYADAAGVVANPTVAPTLSASGSGSGLSAGTYYVHYSWVASSNLGETVRSPEASITITAGQNIVISGLPVLPFGVQQANIYIGTVSGTTKRQSLTTTTTYTQTNALLTGTADSPTVNTSIVPSTINTDYVELSITLNTAETGYTVLQPENPFPVMADNLLTSAKAFPIDSATSGTFTNGAVGSIIADKANIVPYATRVDTSSSLASLSDQALYLSEQIKSDNRMISVSFYIKAISGSPVVNMKLQSVDSANIWLTDNAWNNNVTLPTTWTKYTLTAKMASSAWAARLAIASASASTSFAISEVMINEGAIPLPWSAGRKKRVTLNFLGKVVGSEVENPHRYMSKPSNTFLAPSTFSGLYSQTNVDNVATQNGVLNSNSTSTVGAYRQDLFEFDLSHLGLSFYELKKAFRSFTVSWTGYGSGDNAGVLTYGVTMKWWNNSSSSWATRPSFSNTGSVPATSSDGQSITPDVYITKDQKIYVLVHPTYPASATNSSTLYTDYIKLEVNLADYVDYKKSNIVKVRPETKEIKLALPAHSFRYIGASGVSQADVVSLNYRYLPYQGMGAITKSKIVAVGTPIITTLGTGGYPTDSDSLGFKALSARLPSPVADYLLVADKFTSEGISTTFDSLTLKANPLVSGSTGYRLTPKAGIMFDPYNTSIENPVRGLTSRIALSTDANGNSVGQASYKFSLPTTLPTEALIALPMLVINNGELLMVILSFKKSRNSNLQFYSTEGTYDQFKIQGRPLIKGI